MTPCLSTNRSKPIRELTTGIIFSSIERAECHTQLCRNIITRLLQGKKSRITDYQFELVDISSFEPLIEEIMKCSPNLDLNVQNLSLPDKMKDILVRNDIVTLEDFIGFSRQNERIYYYDQSLNNMILDVLAQCAWIFTFRRSKKTSTDLRIDSKELNENLDLQYNHYVKKNLNEIFNSFNNFLDVSDKRIKYDYVRNIYIRFNENLERTQVYINGIGDSYVQSRLKSIVKTAKITFALLHLELFKESNDDIS